MRTQAIHNENAVVDVKGVFQTQTAAALLIRFDGYRDVWLPKSQADMHGMAKRGEDVTITLPEWLAKRQGL